MSTLICINILTFQLQLEPATNASSKGDLVHIITVRHIKQMKRTEKSFVSRSKNKLSNKHKKLAANQQNADAHELFLEEQVHQSAQYWRLL